MHLLQTAQPWDRNSLLGGQDTPSLGPCLHRLCHGVAFPLVFPPNPLYRNTVSQVTLESCWPRIYPVSSDPCHICHSPLRVDFRFSSQVSKPCFLAPSDTTLPALSFVKGIRFSFGRQRYYVSICVRNFKLSQKWED